MKTQIEIAKSANISQPTISNILTGRRRPSWRVAKRLAEVTCTSPELWLEGSPEQIRKALSESAAVACAAG
jgi:transcriptional regulator with XRE-family HTH domain